MLGAPVKGVQRKQQGAEHTALGGSGVDQKSGADETANLKCLGSVCGEVHYPVTESGTLAQTFQLHKVTYQEK